jgi:hypothetical protein
LIPPNTLAIGNRADTIQVRLRGLKILKPAQAGFVPVDAVSNRPTAGFIRRMKPPNESKNIPPTAYLHPTRNIDY